MIAYGTLCLWWDHVSRATVLRAPTGDRFACPRCGGECRLYVNEESYLKMASRFELIGFAGHRELIAWVRGRCYRTRADAWAAYRSRALARG